MEMSEIKDHCDAFNERQTVCFGISCLGMLSHSVRAFIENHEAELRRVWTSRGLSHGPDFMEKVHDELVASFESGKTGPLEKLYSDLDDVYVDHDDGLFSQLGWSLFVLALALALARSTIRSFDSEAKRPDIFADVDHIRYVSICFSLFNVAEPFSPYGSEMMKKIFANPKYIQAGKDIEHVFDLAKHEKLLPIGERKWDFEFFGCPFDSSKNRDMSLVHLLDCPEWANFL